MSAADRAAIAELNRIERSTATAGVAPDAGAGGLNAWAFNVTGHPAISIPCGRSRGLPLALMAVAAPARERRCSLRLARACAWLWPAQPPVLV